ncbi:MAG TPA: hypothetical protein VI386_32790 [Candidatus Sulfotelmatobacter sp.]
MIDIRSSAFLLALLFTVTSAWSQEKKILRSDLPLAVEKTVASNSEGSTVLGFSQEIEHGQTYYEAKMALHGHSKDFLIDASGTIIEIEEQVELSSLAPSVKDRLLAKAGKGKVIKVESLTKHGTVVAYEAQVLTGRRKLEVQVGPEGQTLAHEE